MLRNRGGWLAHGEGPSEAARKLHTKLHPIGMKAQLLAPVAGILWLPNIGNHVHPALQA